MNTTKVFRIGVGNEDEFFQRGRRIAAAADAGKPIKEETFITFGDPEDLLKALTPARLKLIATVKARSDSIQGLARRLHRDRSAVRRDLVHLLRFGILEEEDQILPGHGRMKVIGVPARKVVLQAEI